MSEDFLMRWSRRKRDAVETEQAKSEASEDAARDVSSIEPAAAIEPVTPAEPVFDLTSLPSIESITAATDIRPFLAPDVPVDIARAALRRAWSIDPRIRDFVGLADYDWDYHTPGSAAGFGPLEMTDELRRMVARIVGDSVEADTSKRAGEPATSTERVDGSPPLKAEAERPAGPGNGPQPVDHSPGRSGPAVEVEPTAEVSAALQDETPQDQVHRSPERRVHGSALPK